MPADKLAARVGEGVEVEGVVVLIEACAYDRPKVFVVGDDKGIVLVGVDGAADELDVVAIA